MTAWVRISAVLAALGLVAGVPASAQRAPAAMPGQPGVGAGMPAGTNPVSLPPPITFFIARGEPDACGAGCREWIAAEGTIDAGADGRLRSLLTKLGGRKLPVFFHSPGGSVSAGLAIGRLMRQRGLTAGVAWTVPAGCDPQTQNEKSCDKLKRSGRELVAELDPVHTLCNSSCVYALVGAAVRNVGAGVRLGIHSSSVAFSLRRTDTAGHVTRTPTLASPADERTALQGAYQRIGEYLREMEVAPGLLAAAREVRNDHVRYLTREEIVNFGIDRRNLVESLWRFMDKSSGASAVKIIETQNAQAHAFRKTILRLSCGAASALRLQLGHEVGVEKVSPGLLRVVAGEVKIPLRGSAVVTPTGGRLPMELRSADLPVSLLGERGFTIEFVSSDDPVRDPSTVAPGPSRLTVNGIGPGLGALIRRCGAGAPGVGQGVPVGRT
jgi:hypothetical protein